MGITELLKGNFVAPVEAEEVPVDEAVEPDALTADPKPAHRAEEKPRSTGRPPRKERPRGKLPTTQAAKKKLEGEIRDNLTMFLGISSLIGMRVDPHCFGAVAKQQAAIVDSMVPIIMRNENMLRWFAGSDAKYLEYIALAQAFTPVVTTVLQHHVFKKGDHSEGSVAHVGQPYDLSSFTAPA